MNIFNYLFPKYIIDKNKKLRLISLFSGYDSQKLGFNYLNIDVEHYRAIEFDKYAMQSLNEIHGTNFTTNDITKITADDLAITDTEKFTYLLTYSFPCTDLSTAGKKAGMEKGSGTRSGLLWEVERLLKESKEKCQVLIMENVRQVLTSKGWREWVLFLESLGYSNYVEVLNAKDYGIPQNRERCFMVSILGDYSYEFPKKIPLTIRLKDILEDEIDEKYYLSEKMIQYISSTGTGGYLNPDCKINLDIARPLTTDTNKRAGTTNYLCEDLPEGYDLSKKLYRVKSKNDNIFPMYQKTKHLTETIELNKFNEGQCLSLDLYNRTTNKEMPTLTLPHHNNQRLFDGLRIRKLTPCECFKLMGVKPSDYNKLTCSNAQKYKQAGNSIVTTVLMAIYSQLFENCDYEYYIDKLIEDLKE